MAYTYDYYNLPTIEDWFNDKQRPKGQNVASVSYAMTLTQINRQFGINNTILHFLLVEMGMNGVRPMLYSGLKQRRLLRKAIVELSQFQIEKEWEKTFKRDIAKLRQRIEHVRRIITENVRLTELYPFFNSVGFERFVEYAMDKPIEDEEATAKLKSELEKYNATHQEEIKAHMESISEEKAIHEAHLAKVETEKKAEKEARKAAEKAKRDEIKEIKKNNEAHLKEKHRIDRSFAYLFK